MRLARVRSSRSSRRSSSRGDSALEPTLVADDIGSLTRPEPGADRAICGSPRGHTAPLGERGGAARLTAFQATLLLSRGAAASAEKKNPHRATSELWHGLS